MPRAKKVVFNVGDEVYFSNYLNREVDEKKLRPGTKVTILTEFETEDNEIAYTVESSKGVEEIVFPDELRLGEKARTTKADIKAAIEADQEQQEAAKAEIDPSIDVFARIDTQEETKKAALLSGNEGDGRMNLILDGILNDTIRKQKRDPLEVAREFLATAVKSFFRMGGALSYIYLEGLYQEYTDAEGRPYTGTNAFNRFIEEQMPGMKHRRARYYMDIYVKFTNWGLTEQDAVDLGWSKCSILASVANHSTVKEWLARAKEKGMTYEKLKAIAKAQHTDESGLESEEIVLENARVGKLEHFRFSVFEDQGASVKEAFSRIQEQHPDINEEEVNKLFVCLVMDYLSAQQAEAGTITQESYVQYGENVFHGKEVLLRDKATGEIYSPHYKYGEVTVSVHRHDNEVEEQEIEAVLG